MEANRSGVSLGGRGADRTTENNYFFNNRLEDLDGRSAILIKNMLVIITFLRVSSVKMMWMSATGRASLKQMAFVNRRDFTVRLLSSEFHKASFCDTV